MSKEHFMQFEIDILKNFILVQNIQSFTEQYCEEFLMNMSQLRQLREAIY